MSNSKHDIQSEITVLYHLLSIEERTETLAKLLNEPILPSSHAPPKPLSVKQELDSAFSPYKGRSRKI